MASSMAFLARAASRGLRATGRPPRVLSSVAGMTTPPPSPPSATPPPLTAGPRPGLASPSPPPPSSSSVAGGGGASGGGLPAASAGDTPPTAGVDVGAAAASGAGAFGDVGAGVSGGGGTTPSPGADGPASSGRLPPPGGEEPAAPGGDADDDEGDGVVRELVHAAMHHVPAHGWTVAAIAAGAADMGLPPSATGLLPGGGAELLTRFLRSVNARLAEQMRDGGPLASMGGTPVDRVHAAVMGRLALLAPVKGRWGEALALGGRPDAVGGTVRATAEFVDEFSWYTKRAGLATIYHTIELYWLTDRSANSAATSAFARRTLGSAASADAVLSGVSAQLGAAARAVAATAEGVLGGSARRGF